ncbi:MAG: thiamine phosphate synthase [Bacillota bacterium]|nr:thiamine phosphate synthase [Bacillota bacterium]
MADKRGERLLRALRVYVITDSEHSLGRGTEEVVRCALAGGIGAIQLREKRLSDRRLLETALSLRAMTRDAGALLIINDRVDIALAAGADGVHVGQDDLPADAARRLLGADRILGVTVETPAEAKAAEMAGADYVGTGPVYSTSTKPDAGQPYGPVLVQRIKASTTLPVVAIGGIDQHNAEEVARAGADGLAVVSAVVGRQDIEQSVRLLLEAFERGVSRV